MNIKEKIKSDPQYTVGALLTLYYRQTNNERHAKTTAQQNDVGFNAFDARILTDLTEFYLKKGFLTSKQIQLLKSRLTKYIGQLEEVGVEPAELKTGTAKKKPQQPQKLIKKASLYDNSWTKIKVEFTFDRELVQTIKNDFVGRRFISDEKCWIVPLTATNIQKLIELSFSVGEELYHWYRKQTEGITNDISVPGLDDVLRPFQKEAISFIDAKDGRVLIADSMGLGKSLESIAWIQLHQEKVFPTIIVCPASVKLNWKNEIEKWTNFGKYVEILYGTTPYNLSINSKIIIINYDILKDWVDFLVSKIKPKLVIGDELHKIKGKVSCKPQNQVKRTSAFLKLAKHTKYVMGLTGTPILNKPVEIYNPLKAIKPSLFPNFKAFAYKFCNPKHNGFAMDYGGASNLTELNQILCAEVLIKRRKEDVAKELPSKSFATVSVELDNKAEYRKAEADLIKYLREIDIEKAKRAKRAETLALINTLKKLAIEGKMKQSIDWIADFIDGGEKLIVFTHLRETSELIKNKFSNTCVKLIGGMTDKQKQNAEKEFWSNDKVRVFVGNIQAAGVGINLQCASNACFLEYPWQPGDYNQACDRCHRIGSQYPVTIWNHIAAGTIEEEMVKLLESKAMIANQAIDGADVDEESGVFNELLESLNKK